MLVHSPPFTACHRHPWLEQTFQLREKGCGLEKGAEAHCLLVVESFVWDGKKQVQPTHHYPGATPQPRQA